VLVYERVTDTHTCLCVCVCEREKQTGRGDGPLAAAIRRQHSRGHSVSAGIQQCREMEGWFGVQLIHVSA
jgi:hypothetical protein